METNNSIQSENNNVGKVLLKSAGKTCLIAAGGGAAGAAGGAVLAGLASAKPSDSAIAEILKGKDEFVKKSIEELDNIQLAKRYDDTLEIVEGYIKETGTRSKGAIKKEQKILKDLLAELGENVESAKELTAEKAKEILTAKRKEKCTLSAEEISKRVDSITADITKKISDFLETNKPGSELYENARKLTKKMNGKMILSGISYGAMLALAASFIVDIVKGKNKNQTPETNV